MNFLILFIVDFYKESILKKKKKKEMSRGLCTLASGLLTRSLESLCAHKNQAFDTDEINIH